LNFAGPAIFTRLYTVVKSFSDRGGNVDGSHTNRSMLARVVIRYESRQRVDPLVRSVQRKHLSHVVFQCAIESLNDRYRLQYRIRRIVINVMFSHEPLHVGVIKFLPLIGLYVFRTPLAISNYLGESVSCLASAFTLAWSSPRVLAPRIDD